jgi:peptide/nickel transport system permease protein
MYESRGRRVAGAGAALVMRLLEVIQAFPVFVFAMVLVAIFGGHVLNIIVAIAFVNAPVFLRLVRSEVLSLRRRPFAEAAIVVGNTDRGLGFRHILPNALPTVVVQISVTVGFAILLTAGLSFVGAGVRPPTPELGAMIASGAKFLITKQWWPALFPGVALGAIVFSFGIFGEILNKALEPRALRGVVDRRRIAVEAVTPDPIKSFEPVAHPEASTAGFTNQPAPILAVERLNVISGLRGKGMPILEDVSLVLRPGETMAVVGESGSGKTVLLKAILHSLPLGLEVKSGTVRYAERDLYRLSPAALRVLRSAEIAAILPNAKSQLNPLTRIGDMMVSVFKAHQRLTTHEAVARSIALLETVGITDPAQRLNAYPHELSGGMAQRVCLALALMHHPKLLIADEPTVGLDVTIQRQVLDLIRRLTRESGAAQLIITSDLGIAAHYCDRIAVMRAGRVVEMAPTERLFAQPQDAYTRHLLASVRA